MLYAVLLVVGISEMVRSLRRGCFVWTFLAFTVFSYCFCIRYYVVESIQVACEMRVILETRTAKKKINRKERCECRKLWKKENVNYGNFPWKMLNTVRRLQINAWMSEKTMKMRSIVDCK